MKDKRYSWVKIMHRHGYVQTFADLFKYIPKTVVAKDLGYGSMKFDTIIRNPYCLSVRDAERMAELFDIDLGVIVDLAGM